MFARAGWGGGWGILSDAPRRGGGGWAGPCGRVEEGGELERVGGIRADGGDLEFGYGMGELDRTRYPDGVPERQSCANLSSVMLDGEARRLSGMGYSHCANLSSIILDGR